MLKHLQGLFVLLLFTLNLQAQQNLYRHFTVEDGLPSLSIYQVTQDNLGYIWLATDKGVGQYDGYRFNNFTVQDGLPTNEVRSIFIDSKNRVWLLGELPFLAFIHKNKVHRVETEIDVEQFNIQSKGIHEHGNTIYIDTEEGLFSYVDDKFSKFDYSIEGLDFLGIDKKGIKWYYDDEAVLYPNGDKNEKKSLRIPLPEDEYLDSRMYFWDKETIYFETLDNFYIYRDSLKSIDLFSGLRLSDQQFPHLISRNKVEHLTKELELKTDYLHKGNFKLQGAFQDNEDNWWFNTLGDGLYLLTANAKHAQTFGINSGLDDPVITAIIKDKIGSIFIGSDNGDLYIISKENPSPQLYPIDNARKIKALAANEEYVFIGSRQGLHVLRRDNFQEFFTGFVSDMKYVSCSPPNSILEETASNYWISGGLKNVNDLHLAENKLLVSTNRGVWEVPLPLTKGAIIRQISSNSANSAIFLDNEIWIGEKSGLIKYEPKTKDNTNKKSIPILSFPINTIAVGADNEIWIGTDGFGIFQSKNNQIKPVIGTEGDIIEKILVDDQKEIWASTNNGIKRIKVGNNAELNIRSYLVGDGLPTKETNTIFTDKQYIYVGTNRGLTILDKIKLSRNTVIPKVYLSNISINNQDTIVKNKYSLSYLDNNFTIQFVGISYKSNQNVTYLFQMEGVDKTWQETKLTELSFIGLSPGSYTFKLKAVDVEGKESQERAVSFTIQPPFWKQIWFQLLIVVLTIAAAYYYMQHRIKKTEQQEQEKAKIQQEKATLQLKIAEEEAENERINNELAKSKLETLQAQMNPHFAYNALTSIQKFVLTKDKRMANRYLVKFARLMRQFLEASKETYISLDKEIELLQLYIEMEQLRFKEKFAVKYEIDPMVVTEKVPIPSMLLQVFVENAINHGLVYKEGNGVLTFKVQQVGNVVECIVEDDGIGRKKANEIKKQSAGAYKGLGMKISHERVKYLNMTENVKVNIKITDEILGEGKGGTRITVSIES
jgi:ligand-binding sensor domain-containing protein